MDKEEMLKWARQVKESGIALSDTIRFQCNRSGGCCTESQTLMYPFDVWRLVHSKEAEENFEVRTTVDLFDDQPRWTLPLMDLFLGENSKLPVASIRLWKAGRDKNNAREYEICPFGGGVFMRPDGEDVNCWRKSSPPSWPLKLTEDGKHEHSCGIYSARPTLCRAFPFGKISIFEESPSEEGSCEKFRPVLNSRKDYVADSRDSCRHCSSVCDDGPETTVKDYLDAQGATQGFEKNALWWEVLQLLGQIQKPELKFALGEMAFDFDRILVAEKLPVDEVIARRYSTFEEHMAEVKETAEGILSRDVDRVVSNMEAFRRRLGLKMPEEVVDTLRKGVLPTRP